MDEDLLLEKRLERLRLRHQEIDDEIDDVSKTPYYDQLRVARLKKERLALRQEMTQIEGFLYPDMPA